MTIHAKLLCAVAVSGFAALAITSPAQALTTQECSAKYKAAKAAGTLGDQKWNDFRKAQCGADATAAPAAAPAAAPGATAAPAAPKPRRSRGEEGSRSRRGAGRASRACGVPVRGRSEIFQGKRRQGADAHLRRSVQRQQGRQRQWRLEVDPEGRRLLQRVHQEAEGLEPLVTARPAKLPPAALFVEQFFGRLSRSAARACADHVRETKGSGRR